MGKLSRSSRRDEGMNMHWIQKLIDMEACAEAVEWCKKFETFDGAWQACERGDWMLWLCAKLSGEPWGDGRKRLVLAACECARLSLKYVPEGELRPLRCIELFESWANGADVPRDDLFAARAAAAAAAADAAYAATVAADAYAATVAVDAAYAARFATLKQCADIARKHYPTLDEMKKG